MLLVDEDASEPPPPRAGGAGGGGGGGGGWRAWAASLVPAAGNLAIQYNFSSLSLAVAILTASPASGGGGVAEPDFAKFTLLGTVFAGAMAGMVGLGAVGDALGRRTGMVATLALVVAGAAGQAALPWGPPGALFGVLAACRFILGVGVGGIYPMAAASAHESAASGGASARSAAAAVGWAFFWQSVGALLPSLVALALLQAPPAPPGDGAWQARLLLGLGAVAAAVPLIATLAAPAPAAAHAVVAGINADGGGKTPKAPLSRAQTWALVGTTSTWLIFDISWWVQGCLAERGAADPARAHALPPPRAPPASPPPCTRARAATAPTSSPRPSWATFLAPSR